MCWKDDPTGDASWKVHEGRLTVLGGAATGSIGVTVKNSLFTGGCADGIQADAAGGLVVQDTEFANITLGLPNCSVHADSVQFYCGPNSTGGGACGRMTFNRDYFHDDQVGIVDYDSRTNGMVVSNSVFVNVPANNGSGNPCDAICLTGGIGLSVAHTTMKGAYINLGGNHSGTPATNTSVRDSILAAPPGTDAGSTFTALDHNICMSGTCTGTGSLNGTPTWTGGASPTTYAGFALASGSLGHNAASDGTDIGVNVPSACANGSGSLPATITPTNFATAVTAATAGQVLCISTGNYGTWTGTNKAITIKADSGQSPTMTFNFSSGGGFTLDGIQGMSGDISGTAKNITIKNSNFTSQFGFDGSGGATGIVFDSNTHNYPFVSTDQNGPNAKIRIDNASGTIANPAITIQNSDIENGDLDGVHIGGSVGSSGVNILNNKFANICENGVNHTDMLQWDIISPGASNERIAGNYFYAAPGCFTQPIGSFDAGTASVLIENNVVDQDAVGNSIELNGDGNGGTGSIVRHNTLVYHPSCFADGGNGCGQISMGSKLGNDPAGTGTHVYDNIASNIQFLSGEATGTMDHNLCRTNECTGTGTIQGSPTFVGGANPTTHDGYLLTSTSLGHLTASDGTDMGIYATGSGGDGGGGPSDPTPPTVSLTAPSAGATVSGTTVTLSANASDNVGVAGVQFKVDGNSIGAEDTTSPYSTNWDSTTIANGTHTITAVARDAAGNTTTSSPVSVTVNNTGNINIGETTIAPTDDSGNANLLVAQAATLSQSASIQSLSFYVTSPAGKLRLGIYDSTGPSGGPGAKVAETAEVTPTAGWNSAPTTTHPTLSAGTYWLTYLPSDNALAFKKSDTSATNSRFYSFTYGALPNTFSTTPSTTPSHWSLYATLTISGTSQPKIGDINQDGSVNIFDLSIMLTNYNSSNASCDLNSDGSVNIFDLSILLSHYGS